MSIWLSLKVSREFCKKVKVNKRSASTPAEPLLSLPMPCGLMPRTGASPRPSCPMVQLIICSATRKLMLAYASLCSITAGCQGQNCSEGACLTDWLGTRGLGLDQKMSGPLRTSLRFSSCPVPAVGPLTPLTVWTETPLTNTNTDMTASQQGHRNSEGQRVDFKR